MHRDLELTVNDDRIKLEPSWKQALRDEFDKPYMKDLKKFLTAQYTNGKKIYPKKSEIFNALNLTPLSDVKVVILGQDPYHGAGQAHGLCFSVRSGVALPPSLQNIFKELTNEGFKMNAPSGDLTPWAEQGVLLLNATLTVEDGKAGSHQHKGWESFTDKVIQTLNEKKTSVVYILWGSYAQKKAEFIDTNKNLVLKSAHPSPLSAHRGFLGNGHFLKANTYLSAHGQKPIDWRLRL